jgi:hypothetical protein
VPIPNCGGLNVHENAAERLRARNALTAAERVDLERHPPQLPKIDLYEVNPCSCFVTFDFFVAFV